MKTSTTFLTAKASASSYHNPISAPSSNTIYLNDTLYTLLYNIFIEPEMPSKIKSIPPYSFAILSLMVIIFSFILLILLVANSFPSFCYIIQFFIAHQLLCQEHID